MLVKALATLEKSESGLVVAAFFLKLLAHEGLQPQLDGCYRCGSVEALVAFDLDEGGVLCRQCRRGRPISEEALDLMRRILSGGLGSVLAEESSPAAAELQALSTALLEHHLERRLRSIAVLDQT